MGTNGKLNSRSIMGALLIAAHAVQCNMDAKSSWLKFAASFEQELPSSLTVATIIILVIVIVIIVILVLIVLVFLIILKFILAILILKFILIVRNQHSTVPAIFNKNVIAPNCMILTMVSTDMHK